MRIPILSAFERHAAWVRVALLIVAVGMLIGGWWVGPFFSPTFDSWANLRAAAAAPVMLWSLLDALWALLQRADKKKIQAIHRDINIVLRELEDLAAANKHSLKLSKCAIKVWTVGRRNFFTAISGEKRRPLVKIAESALLMETNSSGLRWRVGMGVMGYALEKNNPTAVSVSKAWEGAADNSAESWALLPDESKFGLSYDEFLRIARPSEMRSSEPFVLAVPLYENSSARCVVALSMAQKDAEGLKLHDLKMDDSDARILPLMYALAKSAFSK